MPRTTEQLIEGTMARDSGALRELLAQLRPWCAKKLFDRFAHLGDQAAEILDDAESLLFDWSCSPRARELLPPGEPLSTLAFRLVSRVVQQRSRREQRQRNVVQELTALAEAPAAPEAPDRSRVEGIMDVLEALPEPHRTVMLAEVRHQLGEGPPLAELFETTFGAARLRRHKARAVMWRALLEAGLVDAEEIDHG